MKNRMKAPFFIAALALVACSSATNKSGDAPTAPKTNRPLVDQCNDLIQTINNQERVMKEDVGTMKPSGRVEDVDAVTEKVKSAGTAIGKVDVSDAKLTSERDRYRAIFDKVADDIDALAGAIRTNDGSRLLAAMGSLTASMKSAKDQRDALKLEIKATCDAAPPAAKPDTSAPTLPPGNATP